MVNIRCVQLCLVVKHELPMNDRTSHKIHRKQTKLKEKSFSIRATIIQVLMEITVFQVTLHQDHRPAASNAYTVKNWGRDLSFYFSEEKMSPKDMHPSTNTATRPTNKLLLPMMNHWREKLVAHFLPLLFLSPAPPRGPFCAALALSSLSAFSSSLFFFWLSKSVCMRPQTKPQVCQYEYEY